LARFPYVRGGEGKEKIPFGVLSFLKIKKLSLKRGYLFFK
jgi:hypothetical protein